MSETIASTAPRTAGREATFKVASTRDEREAAFRLVYDSYLRSGLGTPNPSGMRVTPYHLLPENAMFIALLDDVVIATMTLVADGDLGMPLQSIFPDEVCSLRSTGARLGEVTCLADRRSEPRRFLPMMLELSRIMVQYARRAGLNALLIAVHPSHARFYKRFMNFLPISNERDYPLVCNHPAQAMCLDFDYIDRHQPECYEVCLGRPLPPETLLGAPMSAAELVHFRCIADVCFPPTAACTSAQTFGVLNGAQLGLDSALSR